MEKGLSDSINYPTKDFFFVHKGSSTYNLNKPRNRIENIFEGFWFGWNQEQKWLFSHIVMAQLTPPPCGP